MAISHKYQFGNTFEKRFWAKVNKNVPDPILNCWDWTACINDYGYGLIGPGAGAGPMIQAHRASWILEFGHIPEGSWILHRCDNRKCVNPKHLFLGDVSDNVKDMLQKGRQKVLGLAKISPQQAAEIRKESAKFRRGIAEKYGIHVTQVCRIISGRRWAHGYKS